MRDTGVRLYRISENLGCVVKSHLIIESLKNKLFGSSEEHEVSGFFVLSHLWMRGYFRLG